MLQECQEKRRLFLCLLLPVMILWLSGCNTQADQSPKTIFDGSLVKTLDAPDVAYYRKRVLDVVAQTVLEKGLTHPDHARVVAVFQALQGNSGISRNVVSDPSNQYQLTKEDVEAVDRFLVDTPEVVLTMSNTVYEYTNMMHQYVQDKPLTIDVLADPVDTTVCSPARNTIPDGDIVEYSYTVYPDGEGFYESGLGEIHGTVLLGDDQAAYTNGNVTRGLVVTDGTSVIKRDIGGKAWPNGVIKYWWHKGFAKEDSCPRKAAIRGQMEAICSLMTNASGQRQIRFECLGNQSSFLSWAWGMGVAKILMVGIDDNMGNAGKASVGYGMIKKLRYSSATVDNPASDYYRYIMQHELCHVLGMKHEHQRPDRDQYVVMQRGKNYSEIDHGRAKWRYKFLCFTYAKTSNYDTPYDYNSIMHYGYDGISLITIRNPAHLTRGLLVWQFNNLVYAEVNAGTFLSPYDIYTLKRHYDVVPNAKPVYTPGMD